MSAPGPLVSVIMAVYNVAPRFLLEAVESVARQTYPGWELMLVDDGSEAATTRQALACKDQWPEQIRYLEHPGHQNRGASASRQLGISRAQGEYIAFLDGDDVWLPHKLEEQLALLSLTSEASVLYGHTEYWLSWSGLTAVAGRDYTPALGVELNTVHQPPTLLLRYLSGTAAVPALCSIIMKRGVLETIGGFEANFRTLYTDQVLYAKLALHAPIFVSDRCWDRYRQHPASAVMQAGRAGQLQRARAFYLDWLESYLRDIANDDRTVWRALRQAQFYCRHPRLAHVRRSSRRLARTLNRWGARLGVTPRTSG